jgi:hypothetical protein
VISLLLPAVIRYDLETLGLCPCMIDVEIVDAKAGNSSTIVSAGVEACTCPHKVGLGTGGTRAAVEHSQVMAMSSMLSYGTGDEQRSDTYLPLKQHRLPLHALPSTHAAHRFAV